MGFRRKFSLNWHVSTCSLWSGSSEPRGNDPWDINVMSALWSRNKYNPLVKACSRFGFCHNFDWRCSRTSRASGASVSCVLAAPCLRRPPVPAPPHTRHRAPLRLPSPRRCARNVSRCLWCAHRLSPPSSPSQAPVSACDPARRSHPSARRSVQACVHGRPLPRHGAYAGPCIGERQRERTSA